MDSHTSIQHPFTSFIYFVFNLYDSPAVYPVVFFAVITILVMFPHVGFILEVRKGIMSQASP